MNFQTGPERESLHQCVFILLSQSSGNPVSKVVLCVEVHQNSHGLLGEVVGELGISEQGNPHLVQRHP